MPTTQKDFDALHSALPNNNVGEFNTMLQNFDLTATDLVGTNCLMVCCRSSSPEVVKLVLDKIIEAGDTALLKSQLTAATEDGWTCLMNTCRWTSSPEVLKLLVEKIIEVGDTALLKSQLTATTERGINCLVFASANCSEHAPSLEVLKLLAVVLFETGLFQQQYAKLDEVHKKSVKETAGIDSSSWTPDAASRAEVKKILQAGDEASPPTQQQPSEESNDAAAASAVNAPPPSGTNLEDSTGALFAIKEAPPNRPEEAPPNRSEEAPP